MKSDYDFLAGGGEMGALMRARDWSATPLGSPEAWRQSLRSAASICLGSRFPIVLYWGPDLVVLYNDAYAEILGKKHPWALGRACREVWSEIWDVIAPMLDGVMSTGEATWSDDQLLFLERRGYPEECYFSFSFSPVRGADRGVDGIFTAVIENTLRVLGERRLRTLRELGTRTAEARSAEEVCREAAAALATDPADIPFSLLYLFDGEGQAGLAGLAGVEHGALVHDRETDALASCREGLTAEADVALLLAGAPASAAERALVLPISSGTQIAGALVAGTSRHLQLAGDYRDFFDLAAARISAAMANARAHEEERKRVEALAELDRAKTAFFSNVSHEFRTPLTLILGPMDEIMAKPEGGMPPENRALLEVAQRNGRRLLKLVNTLLDFARIEAGRAQVTYEPVDLAALTVDLASNFRSACERAGLGLKVDCPPLPEPAWVDREMWEKIVLNLISNAFRFTFEGEIEVRLRVAGTSFELTVRDTGVGIPAEELPRLFERFHRVVGARGRSHEGTGIGLALVQELLKLHGGSIDVRSTEGKGTTFTVSIPKGSAHLPDDRIAAPGTAAAPSGAGAYVNEALSWLPAPAPAPAASQPARGRRVLLADDNADLREYARRLLAGHYEVEAVGDGEAALAAARARRPDLIVSDVMMPRLDGFGLIRELRADPALLDVPVVVISARAGEEARIEGVGRGADDYLVKPFSARELLARVGALLQSAGARRQILEQERRATGVLREADRRKDEFLATLSHELRNALAPICNALELLSAAEGDLQLIAQARGMLTRQVGAMVRLVDELLELSRISEGSIARLPAPEEERPASARQAGESAPATAARRVLVVDDNVDAAETLGVLLRQMGHEVRIAYDGRTALRAASEQVPDILLLDISLPDIDGYALAERLRGDLRLQRMSIVAVTGGGRQNDPQRSREAGFHGYLMKPVGPDALRAVLADSLPA